MSKGGFLSQAQSDSEFQIKQNSSFQLFGQDSKESLQNLDKVFDQNVEETKQIKSMENLETSQIKSKKSQISIQSRGNNKISDEKFPGEFGGDITREKMGKQKFPSGLEDIDLGMFEVERDEMDLEENFFQNNDEDKEKELDKQKDELIFRNDFQVETGNCQQNLNHFEKSGLNSKINQKTCIFEKIMKNHQISKKNLDFSIFSQNNISKEVSQKKKFFEINSDRKNHFKKTQSRIHKKNFEAKERISANSENQNEELVDETEEGEKEEAPNGKESLATGIVNNSNNTVTPILIGKAELPLNPSKKLEKHGFSVFKKGEVSDLEIKPSFQQNFENLFEISGPKGHSMAHPGYNQIKTAKNNFNDATGSFVSRQNQPDLEIKQSHSVRKENLNEGGILLSKCNFSKKEPKIYQQRGIFQKSEQIFETGSGIAVFGKNRRFFLLL